MNEANSWTIEEDNKILELFKEIGNNNGNKISKSLGGRDDKSVENRWNYLTLERRMNQLETSFKQIDNKIEILINLLTNK